MSVVFVGALPPPILGMAAVSESIVGALKEKTAVETLVVRPSSRGGWIGRHFGKALGALGALGRLSGSRARGSRLAYIAVDDGLGGIWTMLFARAARRAGLAVYLHHHSYRYILTPTALMRAVVRAAGPEARHVVLCEDMAERFGRAYREARHLPVVPNSVPAAPREAGAPGREGRPFTIGLLSNLTVEKGTDSFIRILARARAAGAEVRGILAGPATGPGIATLIETEQARMNGALDWLGAVDGPAKEAFFDAIDLFIFPTRYRTESYGLVLIEALIRGVPVIAPRRGCICDFADLAAAEIVPLEEDFEARALASVVRLADDRPSRARLSAAAAQEGIARNAGNRVLQLALVDEMVAAAR